MPASASALLSNLRERGVVLSATGSKLTFDAPAGELTTVDRAALREHKQELLALLTAPDATASTGKEDGSPSSPIDVRPATAPRRRVPKEQYSAEPIPTTACPACSGRRWRLRTTPQTGGAWLWACATCADAVQAAVESAPPDTP